MSKKKDVVTIVLRIRPELANRVGKLVRTRPNQTTRMNWLREAVLEKAEREEGK